MKLKIKKWENWSDMSQWIFIIIFTVISTILLFMLLFTILTGDPHSEYCGTVKWFGKDVNYFDCPDLYSGNWQHDKMFMYFIILLITIGISFTILYSYYKNKEQENKKQKKMRYKKNKDIGSYQ